MDHLSIHGIRISLQQRDFAAGVREGKRTGRSTPESLAINGARGMVFEYTSVVLCY